jgi:hypothetical protein
MKSLVVGLSLAGLVLVATETGADSCPAGTAPMAVSGTIFNSFTPTGGTLGVVHLKAKKKKAAKMTCGVVGIASAVTPPGQISFTDIVSCDDQLEGPDGSSLHSFLVLQTTGVGNFAPCGSPYPPGAISGPFSEVSVPVPGTGRGLFQGVADGSLDIQGVVSCAGAIDMEFEGEFCVPEP